MFAALTFWFPKMFGRMMNETLGKIHFWGTFIPFNCIFLPLFFLGLAGQHRRIYNYQHFPDLATQELQNIRIFATEYGSHAVISAGFRLQLFRQHVQR